MSEVDKMKEVQERSQAIGDFLDNFLHSKGIVLATYHKHTVKMCGKDELGDWNCGWNSEQPIPYRYDIQKLLAEYFGIDLKKVEEEKRKMLEEIRKK